MSKMDAVRAMREARYAEAQARAAGPATKATPKNAASKKAAPKKATPKKTAPDGSESSEQTDARCGHRNISGRTCTRERGHAAKSHRYS